MKIAIPKEAITQIMTDYNCSEEEAAKAYLDADDRAKEAFNSILAERFGARKQTPESLAPKIYTPKEIKSHLNQIATNLNVRPFRTTFENETDLHILAPLQLSHGIQLTR